MDQGIGLPQPARVELQLTVVSHQAVDLLFDVGKLCVAQAPDSGNAGDGFIEILTKPFSGTKVTILAEKIVAGKIAD